MTLEPLHPLQLERLLAMTPDEKLAILRGMQRTAREVRRAAWSLAHPDWDAVRLDRAVAQEFTRART